MAVLAERSGRIIKHVAARVVVHAILPHEGIDAQQQLRRERVLVAESETQGSRLLPLILTQLVICVWNLKPIASSEDVQVQLVPVGRLPIQAIENGPVVADVVEGSELRTIQKTAAAVRVEYQEIAPLGASETESCLFAGRSKRAVCQQQAGARLLA